MGSVKNEGRAAQQEHTLVAEGDERKQSNDSSEIVSGDDSSEASTPKESAEGDAPLTGSDTAVVAGVNKIGTSCMLIKIKFSGREPLCFLHQISIRLRRSLQTACNEMSHEGKRG